LAFKAGDPAPEGWGDRPLSATEAAQLNDPWLDQPAAPLDGVEDKPGTIDPKDQRAIMAHYDRAKMNREQRLAHIGAIVGRPAASTNELSFQEGRRVRDKLKGAAT
jgi:hypothetical protein